MRATETIIARQGTPSQPSGIDERVVLRVAQLLRRGVDPESIRYSTAWRGDREVVRIHYAEPHAAPSTVFSVN